MAYKRQGLFNAVNGIHNADDKQYNYGYIQNWCYQNSYYRNYANNKPHYNCRDKKHEPLFYVIFYKGVVFCVCEQRHKENYVSYDSHACIFALSRFLARLLRLLAWILSCLIIHNNYFNDINLLDLLFNKILSEMK